MTLQEKIHHAWLLRWDQKLEECREQMASLKILVKFPIFQNEVPTHEELTQYLGPVDTQYPVKDRMEILLLHGSLLRALGKTSSGQKLIKILYDVHLKLDLTLPFRFYFERGLFGMACSEFYQSLEDFLSAATLTSNELESLITQLNILLMLENLGLPTLSTEQKIEALTRKSETPKTGISKKSKNTSFDIPKGIQDQLDAFLLRKAFNQGDIKTVLKPLSNTGLSQFELNQGNYFSIWISELPFVCSQKKSHPSESLISSLFEKNRFFYLKSFRLRSLQEYLHPDDLEIAKVSELADRIYLWVWKWLAHPEAQSLERTLLLLEKTKLFSELHRLSFGDLQMIRNALLWLSLFDPSTHVSFKQWIQNIQIHLNQAGYPLLSLENLVIHTLMALRDGDEVLSQDYLKMLNAHPLWNSPDLYFRELIESLKNPSSGGGGGFPLSDLLKNLRSLIHVNHIKNSEKNLEKSMNGKSELHWQIDIQRFLIKNMKSKDQMTSEPLCLAIELLHHTSSVSAEEFCRVVFGLYKYDSFVHSTKINNLLSRMKKYFPMLQFSFRSGRVMSHGDWDKISIISGGERTRHLHRSLRWKNIVENPVEQNPPLKPVNNDLPKTLENSMGVLNFTRQELDKYLGQSRSETHRVIAELKPLGLIKVIGHAKNTRYQISPEVLKKMKEREL